MSRPYRQNALATNSAMRFTCYAESPIQIKPRDYSEYASSMRVVHSSSRIYGLELHEIIFNYRKLRGWGFFKITFIASSDSSPNSLYL